MTAWRERLERLLIVPQQSAQGLHIDPIEHPPPDPKSWPEDWRAAWFSSEMQQFRDCLRNADFDVRGSVLDDLSRYYRLPPEECRLRCLHWEEWSVREWRQRDRTTRDGLQAFYNSIQSWSFDLMWYAYLQACGYGSPASVIAVRFALQHCIGRTHLDFGSGIGATAQLFSRLNFTSTLADVSKPLLDFACWRLARHGDGAKPLLLTSGNLPTATYDIVTAIDTLVHVPDFGATAHDLHRSLRPGGWLLTNFDVRKKGANETAWHLYNNAIVLQNRLERVGFVRSAILGGILDCYQRVDPQDIAFRRRARRDKALLYFRVLAAPSRRIRWPTPRRIMRGISRSIRKRHD
jgi:2-polyprenyl-3-methyl-5-hydroxy-6-metoxy-1,4-benzoquinol methylase